MKCQFWNHTLLTRNNHIVLYVFTGKKLRSVFCVRFVLKTRALNQQNTQLNCTYIKPTPKGCSEKIQNLHIDSMFSCLQLERMFIFQHSVEYSWGIAWQVLLWRFKGKPVLFRVVILRISKCLHLKSRFLAQQERVEWFLCCL